MSSILLTVCLAAVIQLTSSQPTVDVTEQEDNDICTSEQTDHILSVLNHLTMAVSQPRQNTENSCKRTEQKVNELATAVSQLQQTDANGSSRTEQMMHLLMSNVSQLRQNDAISSNSINQMLSQLSQSNESSKRTDQVVSELMAAVSQSNAHAAQVMDQLVTAFSQLEQNNANSSRRTEQLLASTMSELRQNNQVFNQFMTQSSNRTNQVLDQLMTRVTQLESAAIETQTRLSRLETSVSTAVSRLLTGCPTGFTYIASVNGCYKVVKRTMTWTRAGRECQSQHSRAHLLVINDAQEQLAVATTRELTECRHFWTAGYRAAGASTWVWNVTTNGHNAVTAISYTNWGPEEQIESGEMCVLLRRDYSYRWWDCYCIYGPSCLVCEVDL